MSADAPKPDTPPAKWWAPYLPLAVRLGVMLLAAAVGAVGHWIGADPKTIEKTIEVIKEVPVVQQAEYAPVNGWFRDEAAIAANLDPDKTPQFDATPAGRAALGDDDVFLWQSVRKVNNKGPPWYPNVNQQSVGCCVGCGWKHCADVVQATAILAGKAFEWQPVSVEVIYAGSRVDVGGGRISGDGSAGAWAKEYVQSRGGIAPMRKYGDTDLTTFSPTRARQWGKGGVPKDVAAVAKEHPVKGCALVKSWADVKRSIQQGYPVAVCSDQGFAMERDSTGKARPQGTWNHCMAILGVRSAKDGRTEAAFVLNSWGDQAHTGPVWPSDAPVAGFWADAGVIDRMVRQGDSFALADVAGFPARKLDWFVQRPARVRPDRFAQFLTEGVLSW